MRILFSIAMFLLLTFGTMAQTKKAFIKAGTKAMKEKDYFSAMSHFGEALEFDDSNPEIMYKYAEAAQQFNAFDIAEDYYKKVLLSKKADNFPLTKFHLGFLKKQRGDYDAAQQILSEFLEKGMNKVFSAQAKKEIENCKWAIMQVQNPHNQEIKQLDKKVNSPYSEFNPYLSGDSLYYSSYRFTNPKDLHNPPRRISKVLVAVNGKKGKTLKRKFNKEDALTAHTTFGNKGKRIYYTICKYIGDTDIRCNLYYRDLDKRNRWGAAKKMPATINTEGYTHTQPNIAVDPRSGVELLYFVSDRPGGKGGLDIWFTEVKGKNKFSDPQNLASINTALNDITPFYHHSSKTLFFSSDGYQGMGGYDVFQSKFAEEVWQTPSNAGYPLNSSYNDVYFWLNPDSTNAYFSSNRLGSMYLEKENKVCCNDIYKVNFLAPSEPIVVEKEPEPKLEDPIIVEPEPPVAVIPNTPELEPEIKISPPVSIPPTPISTAKEPTLEQPIVIVPKPIPTPNNPIVETPPTTLEAFLPLALYFHNDEPDKQTRRTSTKKTYESTYFDYFILKDKYIKEYTKPLAESFRYEATDNIDQFFEGKVKKGYDRINLFSEILLQRLQEGDKVEIFVKGFTSPRAQSDYNLALGKRRIRSVFNHFKNYKNQIFMSYLASGQLILSEKSFGETTVSSAISDDIQDRRNSIYSVPAALERRVEIVEIKRN